MLKLTSGLAFGLLPKCSVQGMMKTFIITKLIATCQYTNQETKSQLIQPINFFQFLSELETHVVFHLSLLRERPSNHSVTSICRLVSQLAARLQHIQQHVNLIMSLWFSWMPVTMHTPH